MLINPQYEAFFGSVERAGKHSIQTLFYHFVGFPLWPQDSYVVSALTRLCVASPEKEPPRSEAELASVHDAVWQRLVQVDPSAPTNRP